MTNNEKLIDLIQNQMIPDLEAYMDDLFEEIASKKGTKETEAELEETRTLYREFQELLEDAQSGEMDEEECAEIIQEILELGEETD